MDSIPSPIAQGTVDYLARQARRRAVLELQLQQILPERSSFTWEVGCGHGHFLTAYAQAHPDRLCVGVDIASDRTVRAARKRQRAGLERLHFLQADANQFLDVLPPGRSIAEIFILFPDPWPKSRHHKHRILQAEFLTSAALRAATGSRLHFRTDFRPYYEHAVGLLRDHPAWETVQAPWPFEFETVFQSRAAEYHSVIAQRRSAPAQP